MNLIKTGHYSYRLRGLYRILILVAPWIFITPPATPQADVLRFTTDDAVLSAKGPGLLLRDIASAGSPWLMATFGALNSGVARHTFTGWV